MLAITDLPASAELDSQAMAAVAGGRALDGRSLDGLPFANVNVDIDQNIGQVQEINVIALNNIGVLGADLGRLSFNVSPRQQASLTAGFGHGNPFHAIFGAPYLAEGEIAAVRPGGEAGYEIVGRIRLEDWPGLK